MTDEHTPETIAALRELTEATAALLDSLRDDWALKAEALDAALAKAREIVKQAEGSR